MGSGAVLDPEVEQMLTKLNLMSLKTIFVKEELTMTDLAKLSKDDLKDIGISKVKQRVAIYEEVREMEKRNQMKSLKTTEETEPRSRDTRYAFKNVGEKTDIRSTTMSTTEKKSVDVTTNRDATTSDPRLQEQGPAKMVLVTSTGAAAEWSGHCMGVFLLAGEHNNRPYYRQKHTLDTEGARFLYSHDIWYLGCE